MQLFQKQNVCMFFCSDKNICISQNIEEKTAEVTEQLLSKV